MNWSEELLKRGFKPLCSFSYWSNWGYYKDDKFIFSGAILYEKKGKILDADFEPKYISGKSVDDKYYPDDAIQVFYPFIKSEDDKRPNAKHNSIRIINEEELDNYINARLVELADTLASKASES